MLEHAANRRHFACKHHGEAAQRVNVFFDQRQPGVDCLANIVKFGAGIGFPCVFTGLAQHGFARAGIAKSFQITNVFKQLSAHENVRVAAQMRSPRFSLFKPRASLVAVSEKADALLERVGLSAHCKRPAADLAHGQQRALEIAMALACDPELLLMDEPTAGMSPEETAGMMTLITTLATERDVILVEHKMKLVMGICERLIVLHHGEFLAQGSPQEIRANAEVRRVYLGKD